MTTQPHDAEADPAEGGPIEVDWSWTAPGDDWVPPEIDTSKPSTARMYDYALGGKDNYAIDRQAVDGIAEMLPDLQPVALANRGFLIRAVEALSGMGIEQFLDLGSGIPTSPNVHEVAAMSSPAAAKVVYVDNDPVVMTYNRALREPRAGVLALNHDLRDPKAVFGDPALRDHLDRDRPIGLLMVAVLHFVRRETAIKVVEQYRRLLPPGSYLAISAICADGMDPALVERLESVYQTSSSPLVVRTTAQVQQLFDGTRLIDPGLVDATQWRNNENPLPIRILSGVGQVL
jgi:SAM-dependent methyltransferase